MELKNKRISYDVTNTSSILNLRGNLNIVDDKITEFSGNFYSIEGDESYGSFYYNENSDDTVYAKVSGYVKFERVGRDKKQVSVYSERH